MMRPFCLILVGIGCLAVHATATLRSGRTAFAGAHRQSLRRRRLRARARDPPSDTTTRGGGDASDAAPPHTALAQVVANQRGVDLAAVARASPRRGRGDRITAEEVEYYAWTVNMPPATTEAAELAYSVGLDLNDIYDDEDGRYVVQMDDVELFLEHASSLRMTSQTRKGTSDDPVARSRRKRSRRMKQLDERMGRTWGTLSGTAARFTGEVLQQAQRTATAQWGEVAGLLEMKADADTRLRRLGLDAELANEIQEALSCVDDLDDDGDYWEVEEPTAGAANGASPPPPPPPPPPGVEDVDDGGIRAAAPAAGPAEETAPSAASPAQEEELPSLTVVQLKEMLRRRGLKVSGRKVDLVERLRRAGAAENEGRERGGRDGTTTLLDDGTGPLFFASQYGTEGKI